jgi:hypothetical protein
MNNLRSILRALTPLLLLFVGGFAYYAKYHWARTWVDERFPWVRENIGSRLPSLIIVVDREDAVVEGAGVPAATSAAEALISNPDGSNHDESSRVFSSKTVDLAGLPADRALWPKTVKLKKAREFPAVVSGQAVGKVQAPAGSEARLVSVHAGKLGLEYLGGGAWVSPEDTDLAIRLARQLGK